MKVDEEELITFTAVDPGHPGSIALQWDMRHELDRIYDEITIDPPPLEQFRMPRTVFLLAHRGEEAVGCGPSPCWTRHCACQTGVRGPQVERQAWPALHGNGGEAMESHWDFPGDSDRSHRPLGCMSSGYWPSPVRAGPLHRPEHMLREGAMFSRPASC
jgi:hypothetical protein